MYVPSPIRISIVEYLSPPRRNADFTASLMVAKGFSAVPSAVQGDGLWSGIFGNGKRKGHFI